MGGWMAAGGFLPVDGVGWDVAVLEEELDAFEVALSGGQMERGAVIVVRLRHVDAGEFVAAHGRHVAGGGREQQADDVQPFRLVLVPARILLVHRVLQIVVPVEVEHRHQLLLKQTIQSITTME